MSYPFDYSTIQRALLMTSSLTIVMSQLDLSEETMVFYRLIKGVTICSVLMLTVASGLVAYDKAQKADEEALRKGAEEEEEEAKRREREGGHPPELVKRVPVWEDDGSHPSHKLSTPEQRPRLWPFPLGKAAPEKSSMWFESGTGPQIGTFGKPGEKWSSRLQAAQKAREQSESMDRKRVEAIREYEYDQRRKQWKRRLGHLKALCVVVILGYLSTKLALGALALLIWRVINAETARLMKPEPGPGITEAFAARWGTQTQGRKTPYGAQKKTTYPGVGMTYLYQERDSSTGKYLSAAAAMPLRQGGAIQPLITSTNERLAGRDGVLGDEVKGIGGEGGMGRMGGRGGGMSGMSGMGGMGGMSGMSGLGDMGLDM